MQALYFIAYTAACTFAPLDGCGTRATSAGVVSLRPMAASRNGATPNATSPLALEVTVADTAASNGPVPLQLQYDPATVSPELVVRATPRGAHVHVR